MSQTIVNLTLPIVVAKINDILNDSPTWNGWPSLAHPDLRQQLAAYVLRRMPVVYITLESDAADNLHAANCYSHEQHTQIEQLIQQGMQMLIDHSSSKRYGSDQVLADAGASPSSWFG